MASSVATTVRLTRSLRLVLRPQYLSTRWISNTGQRINEGIDKEVKSVHVNEACELLGIGHRYLDVRTLDEFSAGHPYGAINIPYMFATETGTEMSKNPKFLDEVSSRFTKNDPLLLGCKSGRRSLMAANELQSVGFKQVLNIAGGYSAWVENGLPTAKFPLSKI